MIEESVQTVEYPPEVIPFPKNSQQSVWKRDHQERIEQERLPEVPMQKLEKKPLNSTRGTLGACNHMPRAFREQWRLKRIIYKINDSHNHEEYRNHIWHISVHHNGR